MNNTYLRQLHTLKEKYSHEGFIIIGIFGSYARGDETPNSDVDILYELTDVFYRKHPGWSIISAIEDIRKDFESTLGKNIDFADKNALKNTGKKYILPEVQYV